MASPEIRRRLDRNTNDVTALDTKVDRQYTDLDAKLDLILSRLGGADRPPSA